jgi:hypothetical protein
MPCGIEGDASSLIVDEYADLGSRARAPNGTPEMAFEEPPYHARFAHLVPRARYVQPTNRIVTKLEAPGRSTKRPTSFRSRLTR